MAIANRPVQTVILQNYTLDLKLLTENNRTVSALTLTTTGALEGAVRVDISGGTNGFTIAAGTSLTFGPPTGTLRANRQQVLLVDNATFGAGGTATISCAPLLDAILNGSTARFIQDMYPLLGITSFGLQPSPTVVDTTHAQSGSGTSSAIIRSKREISIEGIEYVGDIALEQFIKRTHFDPVFMNRELYAIATYPNGAKFEGAAKSTALNLTGTPMDVMKYTFTLEFQDDWIWSPAYYSLVGSNTTGVPSPIVQ